MNWLGPGFAAPDGGAAGQNKNAFLTPEEAQAAKDKAA